MRTLTLALLLAAIAPFTRLQAQPTTIDLTLRLDLSIEDQRPANVKAELKSENSRNIIQTLPDLLPGTTKLTFPGLTDGNYYVYFSAPGYASQWQRVVIKQGAADKGAFKVTLYRERYVILRYAFNTAGDRKLAGESLKEGRVAAPHWKGLPHFQGDWWIWQKTENGTGLFGDTPYLEFHRYSKGFGFAKAPAGVAFEDLREAPENSAYRCENTKAVKGLTLFCRIEGNSPQETGYGKVMVEDITETPPPGIPVIGSPAANTPSLAAAKPSTSTNLMLHLATEKAQPAKIQIELMTGRRHTLVTTLTDLQPGTTTFSCASLTNGNYYLYFSAPGFATQWHPVSIKDGTWDKDSLKVQLYRQRYAVIRYAFNTWGERDLTGKRVETARVAVAPLGNLPYFYTDWLLRQHDASGTTFGDTLFLDFHRHESDRGFAKAPAGVAFGDLMEAPEKGVYQSERLRAVKGLTLFCRVQGNHKEPLGYGKIMIEDITETPPAGLKIFEQPSLTDHSPASDAKTSGVADVDIQLTLSTDDEQLTLVKVQLKKTGSPDLITTSVAQPGATKLSFPKLSDGSYLIFFSAPGYASQWHYLNVQQGVADLGSLNVDLFRLRYLVLRYVFNTAGERNFTGKDVVEGRMAVSHLGGLPYFGGDWRIGQQTRGASRYGDIPFLDFFRFSPGFGFAKAPVGAAFEDLKAAPDDAVYDCDNTEAVKGLILLSRVNGNRKQGLGYGKIIVEDITETPPPGIKVIEGKF
ncbi:MAG: hypothetical protein ACO1QS_12315 [Verrucomicrobiota bacterium]